jgi:hypothetical protein
LNQFAKAYANDASFWIDLNDDLRNFLSREDYDRQMERARNENIFSPINYYNETKSEATPKLIIKEKPRSAVNMNKQNLITSIDSESVNLLNQHIENIKASIGETKMNNFRANNFPKEFRPFGPNPILNESYMRATNKPVENSDIQMNFYQDTNKINYDDGPNGTEIGYSAIGLEANRIELSNRKPIQIEQIVNNKFNHFTLSNTNPTSQQKGYLDYNQQQVYSHDESYMRDSELKINQASNNTSPNDSKTAKKPRQTIMTSLKNLIIPNSSRSKSIGLIETRK